MLTIPRFPPDFCPTNGCGGIDTAPRPRGLLPAKGGWPTKRKVMGYRGMTTAPFGSTPAWPIGRAGWSMSGNKESLFGRKKN